MAWQSFVLGLAPYVVALVGLVLAAFWGNRALASKDAQLAAKDEQLNTLKLMAPQRVVENIRALHAYYKDEAELTKTNLRKANEQLNAAGSESQALQAEVDQLRQRLEIFEFGTASTASSFIATATLTDESLSALMESVTAQNRAIAKALATLDDAGIDELGRPLFRVDGKILTMGEAEKHAIQRGMVDPALLDDE